MDNTRHYVISKKCFFHTQQHKAQSHHKESCFWPCVTKAIFNPSSHRSKGKLNFLHNFQNGDLCNGKNLPLTFRIVNMRGVGKILPIIFLPQVNQLTETFKHSSPQSGHFPCIRSKLLIKSGHS